MDFDLIELHMVKGLRGKRPQWELSRKLGYSFNQVSKWEFGHKRILWPDFVRICDAVGIHLGKVLLQFFKYDGVTPNFAAIVTKICGSLKVTEVAAQSGIPRFSLSWWLKSESAPSLADILQLMRCYRGGEAHTIALIASLVGIPPIPELAAKQKLCVQRIALTYTYPLVIGVSECFSLKEYLSLPEHKVGFIGKKLGVSVDEEQAVLAKLPKLQVMEFVDGKFKPFKEKQLFQEHILKEQRDIEGSINIRGCWIEQALLFLKILFQPWSDFSAWIGTMIGMTFNLNQKWTNSIDLLLEQLAGLKTKLPA